MTSVSITFHDEATDDSVIPWYGSIFALNQSDENDEPLFWHGVVLVGARSEHEAHDKALNLALRKWKMADGWEQHSAYVSDLRAALKEWREG